MNGFTSPVRPRLQSEVVLAINNEHALEDQVTGLDDSAYLQCHVGQILWGRVPTYPFWPCIITRHPTTNKYMRIRRKGKKQILQYHVGFLSGAYQRSWLSTENIKYYSALSKAEQYTMECKLGRKYKREFAEALEVTSNMTNVPAPSRPMFLSILQLNYEKERIRMLQKHAKKKNK